MGKEDARDGRVRDSHTGGRVCRFMQNRRQAFRPKLSEESLCGLY